jgi:hypothetical protein
MYHVPERFKTLVAAGPYARLDDLMQEVAACDLKTYDILNSMIAMHFNSWYVAHDIGAERAQQVQVNIVTKLLRLRAEISRELMPGSKFEQHLNMQTLIMGDQPGTKESIEKAREMIAAELEKVSVRLEAGRRAATARALEHQPSEVLSDAVPEIAGEIVEAAE